MNWWSTQTCDCGERVHQVIPGGPWLDRYDDPHPPSTEDDQTYVEDEE